MQFKPIRDYIVVEKEEISKSSGGIYIPTTVEDKGAIIGLVLAIGDGIVTNTGKIVDLKVKPGDKILFHRNGCTEVKLDNKSFLFMREENVLGVL